MIVLRCWGLWLLWDSSSSGRGVEFLQLQHPPSVWKHWLLPVFTDLVQVLHRNRIDRIYICIYLYYTCERLILRNWLMQLCRHVKFTICMIGQQARAEVPFESQGRLQQNPFSSRNHCLFQFRPSTELIRPNHSMEDNWLYSKSTDLNANLTKLSLHRNI